MNIPVWVPSQGDDTAYSLRKKIEEFKKRYELNLYSKLPRSAHFAEDVARRNELKAMLEELADRETSGNDDPDPGEVVSFVPSGTAIIAIVLVGQQFIRFDLDEIRPRELVDLPQITAEEVETAVALSVEKETTFSDLIRKTQDKKIDEEDGDLDDLNPAEE